jgi:glycosyltransferase involved in cell wall biosynthesis
VEGLPENYFLTVFNPFSNAQKRHDLLLKLAPGAAMPIVWCFNDSTGWNFADLPGTENVIYLRNLSQEQLYYVYRNATAYVSFSEWESFGWTLCEAFYQGLPIISAKVGMISYVANHPGVYVYKDEEELTELLGRREFARPVFDTSLIDNRTYQRVITALVTEARS